MANKKPKAEQALHVTKEPGKTDARQLAEIAINPAAQSLGTVQQFSKHNMGEQDTTALFEALIDQTKAGKNGDLSQVRAMLTGQAFALNAIFSELARRAGNNMGEYLQATQLYMRLALKAQSQCRSTIEALDRLTNGHVQTVKHVHVNEGAQAIVADQFHQHTGGSKNEKSVKQPHATGAAGESPAMLGTDTQGNGVPIPGGDGPEAVPDARRNQSRRT